MGELSETVARNPDAYALYSDGKMRRIYYEYPSGLCPYSEKLHENIKSCCEFLAKGEVVAIVIDGAPRKGKTTMAVQIANRINLYFNQQRLDLLGCTQFAMGYKEFQRKIGECQRLGFHAIIYDEAGDYDRRGAMSQLNRLLNRTWDTFAQFRIIPIICLPRFYRLDKQIYDNELVKLMIHVSNKSDSQIEFCAYDYEGIYWLDYWRKKKDPPPWKLYRYTTPIFYGHSLRLPPHEEKQLGDASLKGKIGLNKQVRIEAAGLVDRETIARKLQKSVAWVRKEMKRRNINHQDTIDKRKYYEKEIIAVLGGMQQ